MTTRHPPVFVALSCTALALLACDSERQTPPKVQLSSLATPTAIVRVQSGQPFTASCLIVSVGETVEWRNLSPRTAISVVSTREPYELSAPALSMPYNFVPPESSDECTVRTNVVCVPAGFGCLTIGRTILSAATSTIAGAIILQIPDINPLALISLASALGIMGSTFIESWLKRQANTWSIK